MRIIGDSIRFMQWSVGVRNDETGTLEIVAEVNEEKHAKLFVDALHEVGVGAIYFKTEVQF